MDNPFLFIVPRKDEKIINMKKFRENLREELDKCIKGGVVISLVGDYGSGKTLLLREVKRYAKRRKNCEVIEFNVAHDILDKVFSLREEKKDVIIFIDQFDLLAGVDEEHFKNILEALRGKTIEGMTFVIALTPSTLKYISKLDKGFYNMLRKFEIPPLSYEDAKKLIITRLNEVREKESDSLAPFTEEEVRELYEKSKGNPRLLLLLCSSLYDRKMR